MSQSSKTPPANTTPSNEVITTTTSPPSEVEDDPPPGWSLDPSVLEFGEVAVDAASTAQELRAANQGSEPMMIDSIEVIGDTEDFQVSLQCVGALVPSGSFCRVHAQFAPTTAGNKEALVVVGFETDDRILQARLAGMGT